MIVTNTKLGTFIQKYGGVIQTGPFGSQLHQSDYREMGTPVIMPKDIVNDRVDTSSIARVDDVTIHKLSRHILQGGDILYPRRGNLNKRAYITERETGWLCGTGCMKISVQGTPIYSKYLFYFLKRPDIVLFIENKAVGATMPNLSSSLLADIDISYPAFEQQQRIASILSAYDDLIENNTRRIALLEEAMRLLYREWFVRLRFPGHERVKLVEGLPEEWERTIIDQAFDVLGGGTPSKEMNEYWENGTINWYTPTDLTKAQAIFAEESLNKINDVGLANSSAKIFPPNSVMMTSRATIGVIAINTTDACTNQGFITCLPNERVPLLFLYHWLKDNIDVFISHATGATFKEITKGIFRQLPIVLPEHRILIEFEDAVKPMAECVLNLLRQNRLLIDARDLLLPRFMSGECEV